MNNLIPDRYVFREYQNGSYSFEMFNKYPNNSGCSVAGPALPPGYKSSCSSETPDSDDDLESLPLPRDANKESEEETEGDPASK